MYFNGLESPLKISHLRFHTGACLLNHLDEQTAKMIKHPEDRLAAQDEMLAAIMRKSNAVN